MLDLLSTITDWLIKDKKFAIATVTKTWGSSPRPIGSAMLISEDMEMAGSVSGGCIENEVVKVALVVIEKGNAKKLAFGITDDEAWEVGLSCGGKVEVYVEPFLAFNETTEKNKVWPNLADCLQNNKACILVNVLKEGKPQNSLVYPNGKILGAEISSELLATCLEAFQQRKTQTIATDGVQKLIQVFSRKSQLLIIGAAHISADLVQLAKLYDFETIVIDPRGAFTNKTQFKEKPDQVFEKYPSEVLSDFVLDASTFAVVLSHDPKIDDNALHILLRSEVAYIGALGSRKTQAKRVQRLTDAGFTTTEIERIYSPVGEAINAKKPKEIALSVMAQLIKIRNEFL